MAIVTSKSRPGSIVAEAFRLKALAERTESKAAKKAAQKAEPVTKAPAKKAAKKGARR